MRGLVAALVPVAAVATRASGIQMVVGELEKLHQTLNAEQKTDDKNSKDMECWCMRSNRDTTAKKEDAEKLLADSKSIILEKTGEIATLVAEIKQLNKEIKKDNETVDLATKIRKKEAVAAKEAQTELQESITACAKAIEVLSKVTGSKNKAGTFLQEKITPSVATSLVQIISENSHFRDTIQKDLFDFLGQVANTRDQGFLQQEPEPPAGAKMVPASYENSSGKVFGMVSQMHENFSKDLEQSLADEAEKKKIFKAIVKDKTESIAIAKEQVASKTEEKGEAQQALSNATADKDAATMDLDAAVKFLAHVKETCTDATDSHTERSSARADELAACNKAIEILTSDKARALFVKRGMSFLQLSKGVMAERRKEAMTLLLTVGKKTGDLRLSALAMNTRYNFSELISTLGKLAAEKKETKEAEIVKHDQCKEDFADNASQTQTQTYAHEDAVAEVNVAESDIKAASQAIEELEAAIAENNVEIGEATKTRKEENAAYVENVEDMKATKVIVEEALGVLSKMYATEFVQDAAPAKRDPPRQSTYGKNQAGGTIVGLLNQLISSTVAETATAARDEQRAQTAYETTINELNEQIQIATSSKSNKSEEKARAVQAKADAEGRRDEADEMLTQLGSQKEALHAKCDFLLKNMEQRQDALQGEIEALKMAVATLQGARGLGL